MKIVREYLKIANIMNRARAETQYQKGVTFWPTLYASDDLLISVCHISASSCVVGLRPDVAGVANCRACRIDGFELTRSVRPTPKLY